MTLIQELGMLLDEMERVKGLGGPSDGWWHDVNSLEFTLKSIIKDARCPACEGDGRNSPMPDDACMGCSGSGVQN